MRHLIAAVIALTLPLAATAQGTGDIARDAVERHVLPRFEALDAASTALAGVAAEHCAPDAPALREAYQSAFDAWISASHLRFGPTEAEDRAFALAFWPDTRGLTPRSLRTLITEADPVIDSAESFADVSIAARGFYALEMVLFDPEIAALGDEAYRCALTEVMTEDIAALSRAILTDWQEGYASALTDPGEGGPYRTEAEPLQELFKALTYGLEFTSDSRLGRPLGTFDAPQPARAEAWRSGRSLRHVRLSLASLADLGAILAQRDPALRARLAAAFGAALESAEALDDPVFAGVTDPQARLRVESLQAAIERARDIVRDELGPELGVAPGFNALDGD
ncbi:imelysin family protein [Roseovarius aquimarinus]|uniref:Imelysin family protein n=1 Tax=Roseovarius aquimarinus TaxID=1229156 RepID=A0ABW7I9N4_9RHOB